MSRPDIYTNTPDQAATYDRMHAEPDVQDERDDGLQPVADPHGVCADEDCERLLCVLERVVAEQREAREDDRAWAEYKQSQRDEEAS